MKKNVRIGFTGGGSGGHVYPLLAVAEETISLLERSGIGYRLYYFGNAGRFAPDFLATHITIVKTISFKLRRYASLANIIDAIKLPFAFFVAFWKMFWIMPDALFSKGGTGALPVVIAAWFFRVPVFVHESDSVPGLSNSFSFHFAKRVGASFSKTLEYWKGDHVALIGNPLRSFLLNREEQPSLQSAKRIFGFSQDDPLILVLGGSQGSERINDFMLDNVSLFASSYQVLHQTGIDNFEKFKSELAVATEDFIPEQRNRYKIVNYFGKELKEALIAADVVLARSGSGSIFEIAAFGNPSILIPLKESARNHQFYNAYEYAHAGACVVIEEDNLSSSLFFTQLEKLLSNQAEYQAMSKNALSFSRPDAALLLAQELLRIARASA